MEFRTIGTALADAAGRFGTREAFVFENGTPTFRQLYQTSAQIARAFLALGVRRGDRIAVWMAGYAEWAYLYYGLTRIGAIVVPVNTRYRPAEVEYVLGKSRSQFLVFKGDAAAPRKHLDVLRGICPELDGSEPGRLHSQRLPHLRHVVAASDGGFPGCQSFDDLLQGGSATSEAALAEAEELVQGEDTALIQFTSGTTAAPRGAMLYHGAMLRSAYCHSPLLGLSERDRFFSAQPFFHAGGSIAVMLAPIISGCTVVVQPYFEPGGALRLMEEHHCTATMGHQPHWIEYLNHPDLKTRKLDLVKAYIFAAPEVIRRVHREMGLDLAVSPYGLTETHLGGTSCRFSDPLEKRLTTVGRPMPGVELGIRAAGETGFLGAGETGEICFRGWCVMKGYYDDPARTAEVLDPDGWLRTGDLGVVDTDGYLRLVGRIKDMIRVGGENVAALEVEAILLQHENIKQAAVVGAPDERLGEVCAAFVELKPGAQATEEELIQHCRNRMASFKTPRRIHFVEEWPMSGTGKIMKFVLKDRLART